MHNYLRKWKIDKLVIVKQTFICPRFDYVRIEILSKITFWLYFSQKILFFPDKFEYLKMSKKQEYKFFSLVFLKFLLLKNSKTNKTICNNFK